MSSLSNWQQVLAKIKTFFFGKPDNAKSIPFETKITHRKLRIPDSPYKETRVRKNYPAESMLVD